jgi:putative peptide zinc metalloprotease protein
MENAQYLISKRIPILKSKELDEVFTGERKTVFFYSIFYALGIVLTVSLYFIFYIPQLLFAWKKVLPGFTVGPTSIPFWDATLFSLQIIIGLVLLLYSWRKKYVQR